MLKRFANGSSRAVSEIPTGDDTWIYHYDPETGRMSKEWVEEDAPPPTKVRRARSVGKQMWASFSDLVSLSKKLLSKIERLLLPTGTLQWPTQSHHSNCVTAGEDRHLRYSSSS
ncbi:Mariner transposase [Oopsacas minuta]|uniref:Mariner transposase n=1 Tax=Oopsacas minuta TaxID=111878 RepID=A0AAV7JEV9_9METZ|nr:Mariner transposase [Oopsacas minuta]